LLWETLLLTEVIVNIDMSVNEKSVILERYSVEGTRTARGIVELWDAVDRQLERPVVIQILAKEAARDPEACNLFSKHQQIASSIHHSSVQGVYDAGLWEGRPFSVMQKCDGIPASGLYRPGYSPDLPVVLSAARQVAEGLQACREAGLTGWALSPDTVIVDAGGNAHFPIIEGPPSQDNSSVGPHDVVALDQLLRLMLTGSSDANSNVLRKALVSAGVMDLLERLQGLQHDPEATAGHVADEIAAVEVAAMQPTQAYEPDVLGAEMANGRPRASSAAPSPRIDRSEAPTLAAPVIQPGVPYNPAAGAMAAVPQTATRALTSDGHGSPTKAYMPGVADRPPTTRTIRRPLPSLLPLLGLLLVAVLAFALVRLTGNANSATGQSSASASVEVSPTPAGIAAPNLLGKNLDDAAVEVKAMGLNLFQSDSAYNATYEADKVAVQEPLPGESLQAGSYITVSLSLGPEPAANPAPQPPADNPPPKPQPQPNKEKPGDNGKHKGKDK
jgi:serine/threonine-protein kinase